MEWGGEFQPNNEIRYTTSDNSLVSLSFSSPLPDDIPFSDVSDFVTHTYQNGEGSIIINDEGFATGDDDNRTIVINSTKLSSLKFGNDISYFSGWSCQEITVIENFTEFSRGIQPEEINNANLTTVHYNAINSENSGIDLSSYGVSLTRIIGETVQYVPAGIINENNGDTNVKFLGKTPPKYDTNCYTNSDYQERIEVPADSFSDYFIAYYKWAHNNLYCTGNDIIKIQYDGKSLGGEYLYIKKGTTIELLPNCCTMLPVKRDIILLPNYYPA